MPVVQWSDDAHVAARPGDGEEHAGGAALPSGAAPEEASPAGAETDVPSAEGAAPQPEKWVAAEDAAEWNSLLTWARQQRGPQWDTGTGIWQVPRESEQYYGFSMREYGNLGA
ncbi:hypothetical protein MOBT1_002549 [Malassezia obtusa]|uniref:Uncharacterized protein n=1 Tax=Malassezia obtusa TaxID=76774 RepID=A0AAF0E3L1_9BASI|nr:hypothetical protein MOBT1_002549 [Malassezia obtusa]